MQNSTQGFRLSPQQQRLWSQQQADTAHPYRAVCAILLEGDLNPRVLEQALYHLVQRHEILRTTFQRPTGIKTPFQVVSETVHPGWQAVDLSHLDPAHQTHHIQTTFAEERARPLNFERPTLLRVSAFKLSPHRRVMIVSLPSLCADSVTLTNFAGELSATYETLLSGQQLPDAVDSMQYADFAEWQNELLETDDEHSAQGKAYWEGQTAAVIASPVLPLEKVDKTASFSPASVKVVVDKDLRGRIEALARESDATISDLLFASWQALIWRLTGQSDFLIFNLSEGRKLDDLKSAFGLYAGYLPVRCRCEDVPFAELVRAGAAANEGCDWQEYYELSGSPATHVAFEFAERPTQFETSELMFSILRMEVCHQPFKLKLLCARAENVLTAELQYDARVFDRETIERFAGYWQRFLAAQTSLCVSPAVANSQRESQAEVRAKKSTIGTVDILSAAERSWLLFDLNQTQTAIPDARCTHELFAEQVARTPQAVALVSGEIELTYEQLNIRANQLAHLLASRGVRANDRVGLCLPRSAEMIIGLLGILKAGGAYVPLNPEHPVERLAFQLAESNASLLITNAAAIDRTFKFDGERIDLDLQRDLLAAQAQTNPSTTTTPDNLVYVIYTSGSTGVSKGVAVQHRNLVNYTNFILRRLNIATPLHFAYVSTIAADLGNTCIFPSLLSGGCLHVLGYDIAMDGDLYRKYVSDHPIDVLKIVPSHFQSLLATAPDSAVVPSRFLLFGGEALSHELVERVVQVDRRCRIINHYGPTETTVGSLTFEAAASVNSRPALSLTVPIGKPIANTRVYVLDKNLQPQPVGVAGELYIGGAGVAAGYLRQAEETAVRFVADPFACAEGERLYRTGDMVRYLADGNIEFLGRVDNQIKIRGFRVELGEIETALALHPGVRQAVVTPGTAPGTADILPAASPANTQALVAYIVPAEPKPPSPEVLRDFLRLKLPDYMIPAIFISLASLPLTPNGKIDRAALPAPDDLRPNLQKAFVAPRNETEKELANIWSALLGVSEVGVEDNFFDLGGHSLLATQVVSRMRQVFQAEIPLASIFQSPTVAALAETIDNARTNDTERLLAELEQLSDSDAERLLREVEGN